MLGTWKGKKVQAVVESKYIDSSTVLQSNLHYISEGSIVLLILFHLSDNYYLITNVM